MKGTATITAEAAPNTEASATPALAGSGTVPPKRPATAVGEFDEYDFAFAVVERIRRAASDLVYRLALIESYALSGLENLIPGLVRAIDEYRDNNSGELVAS